jgi:hypothetical protein
VWWTSPPSVGQTLAVPRQSPAVHDTPLAQAIPQPPQLSGSLSSVAHAPPQNAEPVAHAVPHVPPLHD